MHVHTYSLFFKLIYRFGNIPVSLLLLLYLVPSVLQVDHNLLYLIPVIIILLLVYYVNRHFLYLYKIIPYKIISDREKLYCTDFFMSKKESTIYFDDIISLKGGVFDGNLSGLMKVYDGRNKIHIGFYPKISEVQELQKAILNRVSKIVYDEVAAKVEQKRMNK